MGSLLKSILLAVSLLALSGCGTVYSLCSMDYNHREPGWIYGGVQIDLNLVMKNELPAPLWAQLIIAPDIPLSACADTITLPYTIFRACIEPKAVYIFSIPSNGINEPKFIFQSAKETEPIKAMSVEEICAALSSISGRRSSVEIYLDARYTTLSNFGRVYEVILANPTLKLFYKPEVGEKNLEKEYLMQKKANNSLH